MTALTPNNEVYSLAVITTYADELASNQETIFQTLFSLELQPLLAE